MMLASPEDFVKIRLGFMASSELYEFGEFTLDASERRLSRKGQAVALEPKAHDVLVALLRRAGRLMTKRDLLDEVWPESFVEEGILAVHVSALRRAMGDREHRFIETVPRAGYRFVGAIHGVPEVRWSVAVLPAVPFSSGILSGRDRSTGLALTDHAIDRLGTFSQMIVRPTRAVREYLNVAGDPAAIGRSLRVDAVIDLHFFRSAERVRVSAALIRSRDGALLWSGEFDEPATDLMRVASTVARSAAAQLGSAADTDAPARSTPRSAARPEVYELFGRGRSHLLASSMFEVEKAADAFRAAIELDPTYAAAHAGLALACCAQAWMRSRPPEDAYSEARSAALRALAMDDSCADAQVALGAVLYFSEWNWSGAERSLKRALQLNPNHTEAYLLYGQLLETLGHVEAGLGMKLKALERDPFSPLVHLQISLGYWNQRRYDEAIEWAKKTLEIDPRHPHARENLAGAYWKKGDFDRQMEENIKHAELHGAPPAALDHLKRIYADGGHVGVMRLMLQQAAGLPAMQLAIIHGETGDLDNAFRHLDRALDGHDPSLVHLAIGPQWDSLRGDPRFGRCLTRMGLVA